MTSQWSFAFTWPVLAGGLVVILAATWLSYQQWRRAGARRLVLGLEVLRWLLVALLFFTLGRPEFIVRVNPDEDPVVAVLRDGSRSMTTRDVVVEGNQVLSRREWIERELGSDLWKPVRNRFRIAVEDFSPLPADGGAAEGATNLLAATFEEGTDINAALEEARARHRNLRAVVVLSDGDWNLGKSPVSAATKLRMDGVPVFGVAVGSETYLPDVMVANVSPPAYAITGESVFIPFTVRSYMPREVRTTVRVKGPNGTESSKEIVIPPMGQAQDALFWRAQKEGRASVTLAIEDTAGELRKDNNAQMFAITVRRELLKVLVVDTLPRWEYRFLRNALSRDPGVEVKCVLLHPGLKPGGGRDYLPSFPAKPEELSVFDVVFLGDIGIGPEELTAQQAEMIKGLVEQQGSGLVFMPGSQGKQLTLATSALNDLIPVIYDTSKKQGLRSEMPSRLILTRQGRGHLLTMLASSEDENYMLWRNLPGFTWHAAVEKSRPGSEVLAVHDTYRTQWGKIPLLATRPAGNGKVLFMGTDAAWRWRKGVEDLYHYRFWGQVVRWMAYQRHLAHTEGFRVLINPDKPRAGETVFLNATVFDQFNSPLNDGTVTADVIPENGAVERLKLRPVEGGWGVYQGQFTAAKGGKYKIRLSCVETARTMEIPMEVQGVVREHVGRPARADTLREVAAITRGQVVAPAELASLVSQIAKMPEAEAREQRLRLWCHPVWAGLIVLLLAVYWIGRKAAGLI